MAGLSLCLAAAPQTPDAGKRIFEAQCALCHGQYGGGGRGAAVFAKAGCAGCHIVEGRGEGFGPELTGIGDRRSASWLKQTILRPADSLPEGFLYMEAVAKSGEKIRGIRANEDSFTVQIKDKRGFHSLRKADLRELRKLNTETPMPSYEKTLNGTELDDLVAWLAGLKEKP